MLVYRSATILKGVITPTNRFVRPIFIRAFQWKFFTARGSTFTPVFHTDGSAIRRISWCFSSKIPGSSKYVCKFCIENSPKKPTQFGQKFYISRRSRSRYVSSFFPWEFHHIRTAGAAGAGFLPPSLRQTPSSPPPASVAGSSRAQSLIVWKLKTRSIFQALCFLP